MLDCPPSCLNTGGKTTQLCQHVSELMLFTRGQTFCCSHWPLTSAEEKHREDRKHNTVHQLLVIVTLLEKWLKQSEPLLMNYLSTTANTSPDTDNITSLIWHLQLQSRLFVRSRDSRLQHHMIPTKTRSHLTQGVNDWGWILVTAPYWLTTEDT